MLGRKLQKSRDEAFAEGVIGVGHEAIDEDGEFFIGGAGDVHRLRAVVQPGKRDVEHAADEIDKSVVGRG